MATEIEKQCETIEECYEFTLSYAARGVASEDGTQLREHLTRAVGAMRGLEASCAAIVEAAQQKEKFEAFSAVLKRDAASAIAAIDLVLAAPAIGSQLIDNLNASIHWRALLADLFLLTEILDAHEARTKAAHAQT